MNNILVLSGRAEWRSWLTEHARTEKECRLALKRVPPNGVDLTYLDAVEEALCFGWIDSTLKKADGVTYQGFSPRRKGGLWSELNKARARRLIRLGLMTDEGRKALPDLDKDAFRPDREVVKRLREAGVYETFLTFPPLYRRVRLYNAAFAKRLGDSAFSRTMLHLIEETAKGHLFGEWNDYGRLSDDE